MKAVVVMDEGPEEPAIEVAREISNESRRDIE